MRKWIRWCECLKTSILHLSLHQVTSLAAVDFYNSTFFDSIKVMAEDDQPGAEGSVSLATSAPEVDVNVAGVQTLAPVETVVQPTGITDNNDELLTPLELMTMERDHYRQKLETVEAELAALTAASPDADTINKLHQDNDHLRKTLKKATDMLREKITSCNVQEKKNAALTQQVTTLKEVLQVTRDLLNIRNMEVEQLQKSVDTMEARIDDNRKRQTAMIKQMEQATKINGQLRTEYETQLHLFQSLKERYEEKVTALTNLAYQRQRLNSESSEKFEDAPEVVAMPEPDTTQEGTENEVSMSEIDITLEENLPQTSIVTNASDDTTPAIPDVSTDESPQLLNYPQEVVPEEANESELKTT